MTSFDEVPQPEVADQPVEFAFMKPAAWLEFTCEVYDVIDELAVEADQIESGMICLHGGWQIGLLQLAQQCHLRPRDDWHMLIADHLETMTAHLSEIATTETVDFSIFDLRVRLVADNRADRELFHLLGARPFAEGIVAVLAVDVPGAVRMVPSREVEELGWHPDEAWASAWAQTESLEQPDEINVIDVGGADVLHIFGERVFCASLVADLEEYVGPIGPHGALVSIPHSHSVLVHPIDDITVTIAINAMIPITRQIHRQGPESISPQLYWWQGGTLTTIPTYFAADGIEVYPSAHFVAVLRSLR